MAILGPTATGKTDIALYLAKKFNGELLSCDSRQIYKGLDIGTGKLPDKSVAYQKYQGLWLVDGIKVWGLDLVSPSLQFNVKDYVDFALPVIGRITANGKLPIIVGGTGLYFKGLVRGFASLSIPLQPQLRRELDGLVLSQLQARLKKLAPGKWRSMNNSDRQNPRRLIRAIEIVKFNFSQKQPSTAAIEAEYDIFKVGLIAPKAILEQRISQRLDLRIKMGMVDEVISLHQHGLSLDRMRDLGLEYRVGADYLDQLLTFPQMVQKLNTEIRQYAKRQITWFKKEPGINWFDISQNGFRLKLERRVKVWYDQSNDSED